jgi:hypothetical protein
MSFDPFVTQGRSNRGHCFPRKKSLAIFPEPRREALTIVDIRQKFERNRLSEACWKNSYKSNARSMHLITLNIL